MRPHEPSAAATTDQPDDALLGRYLAGEASAPERVVVDTWAHTSPDRLALLQRLHSAWAPYEPSTDAELLWERVRVRRTPRVSVRENVSRGRTELSASVLPRWFTYSATALTGACLAVIVAFRMMTVPETAGTSGPTTKASTYVTAPGQRAQITLADGTRILLNVASKLSVSENFAKGPRTVHLEGEAQFTVTHDAARPFTVVANDVSIRDLATTFTVRSYDKVVVRVAVRDGRVSVQPATLTEGNAVSVGADQIVTVTPDSVPRVSRVDKLDPYFAWTEGRLVFLGTPLGEALTQLGRWYGLKFRVSDSSLFSLDLNGELPAQFNATSLESVAAVIGARVERVNNVVTFIPKE